MKIYENNRAEILALLFLYTFKNIYDRKQGILYKYRKN